MCHTQTINHTIFQVATQTVLNYVEEKGVNEENINTFVQTLLTVSQSSILNENQQK